MTCREHESIARGSKPLRHLIGSLYGGSGEYRELAQGAALRELHEIPRRRVRFAAQRNDAIPKRLQTGNAIHFLGRQRVIETLLREIEIQRLRQEHETVKGFD